MIRTRCCGFSSSNGVLVRIGRAHQELAVANQDQFQLDAIAQLHRDFRRWRHGDYEGPLCRPAVWSLGQDCHVVLARRLVRRWRPRQFARLPVDCRPNGALRTEAKTQLPLAGSGVLHGCRYAERLSGFNGLRRFGLKPQGRRRPEHVDDKTRLIASPIGAGDRDPHFMLVRGLIGAAISMVPRLRRHPHARRVGKPRPKRTFPVQASGFSRDTGTLSDFPVSAVCDSVRLIFSCTGGGGVGCGRRRRSHASPPMPPPGPQPKSRPRGVAQQVVLLADETAEKCREMGPRRRAFLGAVCRRRGSGGFGGGLKPNLRWSFRWLPDECRAWL